MLVSRRLLGALVASAALLGALQPVGGFTVPLAGGRAGGAALARTAQRRGRAAAAGPRLRMQQAQGGPEPEEGLSEADISGLLARVSAAKDRVQMLPVCVLDATLPRQRLEFATQDTSFLALLAHCKVAAGGEGLGKFGMLGVDRVNRAIMRHGTEVEITKADELPDGSVAVELRGQRCFQLLGDPWLQEAGVDEDPAPAPLSSVAAATQDTSKYIMARVEYAADSEDGVSAAMTGSAEEMGKDSEQMIDALTAEADYEANLQMSTGMLQRGVPPG
jgi:Lon protease-like protein